MRGKYDDIIHLARPVSAHHPPMPMAERAGQFSAFAALVGHDAAIRETGRLTQEQAELDESRKAVLNEKLQRLLASLDRQPTVQITWFRPDERKSGGAYVTTEGIVKKADPYGQFLELTDGLQIPVEQIYEITAEQEFWEME